MEENEKILSETDIPSETQTDETQSMQYENQAEAVTENVIQSEEVQTETTTGAAAEAEVQPQKPTKKQQFIQILKFTLFSASAGVIQLLSTSILHEWTGWLVGYYYIAYIIGLTLSVIWNFTFNRKFTFKAANNIPLAMVLVIIYNCIIVVPLAFGGDALVKLWGKNWGILVTAITLLINFVTEFFWDKFVVFNPKATDKILKLFKKKEK